MLKAYKIQLGPNNSQTTKMRMNCGASRFAFNYALNKKKDAFDKKEHIPTNIDLHRELNKMKGTVELPWAYAGGISKCSFQEGLRNCDRAFANFFKQCKKKTRGKNGFPKFKSKKNDKQSFGLTGSIKLTGDGRIQLPRIGKVRLTEPDYIPSGVRIISATVSSHASRWFVSVLVEQTDQEPVAAINAAIGVDLGIKSLAVCSNGEVFENPKALRKNLRCLKRRQRRFSKKVKGGKNREKAKKKLAKLHYRISCVRKDALHKITTKIVNENQVIVLEDLKVSNMMNNHKLAQAIADVGLYEFRRQIEYKSRWKKRQVVFVGQFFPSSKRCSHCGNIKSDLTLKDRVYNCAACGSSIDRDLNASFNLEQCYTDSSSGLQACGDQSSSSVSLVS